MRTHLGVGFVFILAILLTLLIPDFFLCKSVNGWDGRLPAAIAMAVVHGGLLVIVLLFRKNSFPYTFSSAKKLFSRFFGSQSSGDSIEKIEERELAWLNLIVFPFLLFFFIYYPYSTYQKIERYTNSEFLSEQQAARCETSPVLSYLVRLGE